MMVFLLRRGALCGSLLVAASFSPVWAQPAGSSSGSASGGLSFEVMTRFQSGGAGSASQSANAKVTISGAKARVETGQGRARSLLIYSPPTVAKLLPASKAGVKWQVKAQQNTNFRNFDPEQLLRNPAKIRAAMLRNGGKKLGTSVLNGTPVEIYTVSQAGGEKAKVWLRRSDALPLRLEAKSRGVNVVASWKNYVRLKTVSPSLFQIPAGYKVRTLQSAPPLSGL